MRKVIILISVLSCVFISGCSTQGKRVESLEEAYIYLIDEIENNNDVGVDYVKRLLKDYEVELEDNSDAEDEKGEKKHNYRFTDDNDSTLNVSFIISNNKESVYSVNYKTKNHESILDYSIVDGVPYFYLTYSDINKSIYKEVIDKIDTIGITMKNKEEGQKLANLGYSIADKIDNGDNVEIKDIKKLLKNYNFEFELESIEGIDSPQIYKYTFSNNESGKLLIEGYKYDDREDVTDIKYKVEDNYNLTLILGVSPEKEVSLFISYISQEIDDYMNLYNLTKKHSQS